jgi:outer membrane protein OmpA-like peptidoglycan-associated protein
MQLYKMKIQYKHSLLLALFFCGVLSFAQEPKNKVVLSVCIDGADKLHIKAGKMYWEHISDIPPGQHELCKTETKVNAQIWEDWKFPFTLYFNTDSLTLKTMTIQKHDFSKLIQAPSNKNNWETIWSFSDPANEPHQYKVSFMFSATVPKVFIPNNISFETGSAILTSQSLIELDKIYVGLVKSGKTIEILGHTDNQGKTTDNLRLSKERAKAVYEYLLSKGFNSINMSYKGLGAGMPIVSDDTEENRMKNRRVEIIIIK